MKRVVIYESATGFTKQYAEWIGEALKCPCIPLKQITKKKLMDFDQVLFGGWIMGNGIAGLSKLQSMAVPAAVFAVGATPYFEEVVSAIKELNKLDQIPFFYMVGGFHFDKLGFGKKTLLKALKKSVSKKENRSRQEDFMAEVLCTSFDHSCQEEIIPFVHYIQSLSLLC